MISPRKFRFTTLIAAAMAVSAAAVPLGNTMPELRDQFNEPVALASLPGQVEVAIVVSAKRLRRIKPWEKALRTDFPDLRIVRIADIPRTSSTEYDVVAEKLRKRLPADLAVGIDLKGEWASALALDTKVPNILIFDTSGNLSYRQSAMFKSKLYPPLQSAVNDALTAAAISD